MSSLEAECCQRKRQRIEEIVASRDRISSLPTDLLIRILLFVSTKDVVSTMVLSKRWRYIWTLVPKLEFKDSSDDESRSCWKFLGKFLELHKAPVLQSLCIHLSQEYGIDVEELVSSSVDRFVRNIELELLWTAEPTSLPKSLYTCKTLVKLTLSNKILVDVPSSACFPSLKIVRLLFVVFKDEDSLKNLVSSCSVLARSRVGLFIYNNWTKLVPVVNWIGVDLNDVSGILVYSNTADKCLRVNSLVTTLYFVLRDPMITYFNGITFSRLQTLMLKPSGHLWFNLFIMMLNNSPKLKVLSMNCENGYPPEYLSFSWIQPNFFPRCLSSHLEELCWMEYRGNEQEKQVMRYILANSKCLKKATITLTSSTLDLEEEDMIIKELKSMSRVSTSKLVLNESI